MGLSREFTHLIQERIKRAYSKTADSQPMILYKQAHAIEVLNTPSLTACKHYHYCPFTHYRFARKVSFSISMVTVPHSRALGAPAAAAAAAVAAGGLEQGPRRVACYHCRQLRCLVQCHQSWPALA
mmetsp:Transcript_12263/g.32327  ORF Transcript_12263/g.32327 Transcript_12263/m.32327 type:complete len:126 (+) Transcript_12263:45-422(+)